MNDRTTRWEGRRTAATAVEVSILLAPVLAASVTLWTLAPRMAELSALPRLVLLLLVSSAMAMAVERWSRRLLPLSALLRLTMVFPDRAPSRFTVARQAGNPRVLMARLDSGDLDEATAAQTILGLVGALAVHDRKTRGHSERVRAYTDLLSTELGIAEKDRDRLRWAALLHDIGKLRVDVKILNKPGKPSAKEWVALRAHPEQGRDLAGSMMPWLGTWGQAIVEHHERYDGGGYPFGLSHQEISLGGRIVAVVDAFETMTAVRAYKKAMSHRVAREQLASGAGSQFDPDMVRAFLAVSLPKMLWAMGPLSAALQLPWVHSLQFAGSRAVGLTGVTASAVSAPILAASVVTAVAAPAMAAATTPPPARSQIAVQGQPSSRPERLPNARTTAPGNGPTASAPKAADAGVPNKSAGRPVAHEVARAPGHAAPKNAAPATGKPSTRKPSDTKPNIAKPTTAKPTTAEPTTAKPTTAQPSGPAPTAATPIPAKNKPPHKAHKKLKPPKPPHEKPKPAKPPHEKPRAAADSH